MNSERPKLNFISPLLCYSAKQIEDMVVILSPIHMEALQW